MKHIIEAFHPSGGKHCITNALMQVFDYYHRPLSEAMLFGIGSGLSFTYINLAHSPMISGRSKPIEFEAKLAERLGVRIKCRQPKNYPVALAKTKKMIQQNKPVLIYVDMPFLDYLNMNRNSHFGGHAVVLFGYDDENQEFYLTDRDSADYPIRTPKGKIACDYHRVSYQEMERARNSNFRPFPANNKYLEFDFSSYEGIQKRELIAAIKDTCESMLRSPAKLLGINGIIKFSQEILKWKSFDQSKREIAGITNYFQISEDGGTGGGAFRKMYGEFLIEGNQLFNNHRIEQIGQGFMKLGEAWDSLAEELWQLGTTGDVSLLCTLSEHTRALADTEKILLEELEFLICK